MLPLRLISIAYFADRMEGGDNEMGHGIRQKLPLFGSGNVFGGNAKVSHYHQTVVVMLCRRDDGEEMH